jgi:hypothetical protein
MADYLDVTVFEMMDEPAEVSFTAEGTRAVKVTRIKGEEEDDGFATTYRVQLRDLERA